MLCQIHVKWLLSPVCGLGVSLLCWHLSKKRIQFNWSSVYQPLSFVVQTLGSLPKKFLHNWKLRFSLCFLSKVSITIEISNTAHFCQWVKSQGLFLSIFFSTICWKYYSFPHWVTLSFLLKINWSYMCGCIFGHYILFYWCTYVSFHQFVSFWLM